MKVLLPFLRTSLAAQTSLSASLSGQMDLGGSGVLNPPTLLEKLPPVVEDSRRVILVGHGETDWCSRGLVQGAGSDLDLNDAGRYQAGLVRDQLEGLPIGVIASSHLSRSEQTADIIANAGFDALRIINHKCGEMRLGEFEGLSLDRKSRNEFENCMAFMHENKLVPWPGGGESISDVERRAVSGINQILNAAPDCDHICVVAHGRWNSALLTALIGLDEKKAVEQGNACINVMDVDKEGNWKAHLINHIDHIENTAFA